MSYKPTLRELVTENDWQAMLQTMNEYRQAKDWWNFFWVAQGMKLSFLNRADELNLTEEDWQGIKGQLDSYVEMEKSYLPLEKQKTEMEMYRSVGTWQKFAPQAMAAKALFPDKVDELGLTDVVWDNFKQVMAFYRKENNWPDFAARGMAIKILFPERAGEIDFNDQDWEGMMHILKQYYAAGNWWNFPSLGTKMKIMFPHRGDDLGIDEKAWRGMEAELAKYRQENRWQEFAVEAVKIRVLTTPGAIVEKVISSRFLSHLIGDVISKYL